MGAQELAWAWRQDVDLAAKAVLARLAEAATNWQVHMTAEGVAGEISANGRTVRFAFARLEEAKVITVRRRGLVYLRRSAGTRRAKVRRPAAKPAAVQPPSQETLMATELPEWAAEFNRFEPNAAHPIDAKHAAHIEVKYQALDIKHEVMGFLAYWRTKWLQNRAAIADGRKPKGEEMWPPTWVPYGRLTYWLGRAAERQPTKDSNNGTAVTYGGPHDEGNPACMCVKCGTQRGELPPSPNRPAPMQY